MNPPANSQTRPPLSDDDGIYSARAWRRAKGGMDPEPLADLYTWVRSMPPSKLCVVLSATHTMVEVLELLDAAKAAADLA